MATALVGWQVGYDPQTGTRMIQGKDIQIEEGKWAKIHNDILEAVAITNLNGTEKSLLLFLFRKTYGWNKKDAKISLSEWQAGTRIPRHNLPRALRSLEEKRVIYSVDNGRNRTKTYGFNKYIEQWDASCIRSAIELGVIETDNSLNESVIETDNRSVIETDNKSVIETDTHKRHKEKERKEEEMSPPRDPFLKAAADKYNRRLNGKPVYGQQFDIAEWNAQLAIGERLPIVEAIADVTGKRLLWDAGDERLHTELHTGAITAHKMGYTTAQAITTKQEAWRADWRGKNGGSVAQFLTFLSEQHAPAAKAPKRPRLVALEE